MRWRERDCPLLADLQRPRLAVEQVPAVADAHAGTERAAGRRLDEDGLLDDQLVSQEVLAPTETDEVGRRVDGGHVLAFSEGHAQAAALADGVGGRALVARPQRHRRHR